MSTEQTLVTASFTIPTDHKERIERMAKDNDLNASQVIRRILADYFSKLDAAQVAPTNGKTRKAAATA